MKDVMSLNMQPDGKVIVNGPQGITGTPNDASFTVGVLLVLLTLFVIIRIVHSRDGRAIMAIRDNRIAAESVGINITKYKLMAFTVSAALAGLAGVLYAHNLSTLTATTNNFGYNMSIIFWYSWCWEVSVVWKTFMIRSGSSYLAAGNVARTVRLSYADLCDYIDRDDVV